MNKELLISSVEHLLSIEWITSDLKEASKKVLEDLFANKKFDVEAYKRILIDSIATVEEVKSFAYSDHAKAHFGEAYDSFIKEFEAHVASGAKYCGCEACSAALKVLELLK